MRLQTQLHSVHCSILVCEVDAELWHQQALWLELQLTSEEADIPVSERRVRLLLFGWRPQPRSSVGSIPLLVTMQYWGLAEPGHLFGWPDLQEMQMWARAISNACIAEQEP